MKRCAIIYGGRNDNYHSDYLQRTSFCLNYNMSRIRLCNGDVEFLVVFVDWSGSDYPLSSALDIHSDNRDHIRFIQAKPIIGVNGPGTEDGFSNSRALNIGLRHVDADYFVFGASDLIGSRRFWYDFDSFALRELGENRLAFVPRRFLPVDFLRSAPTIGEIEYLMDNVSLREDRVTFAYGNAGLICGSRAVLHDLGGFNERFSGWGGDDTELFLTSSGQSTPTLSTESSCLRVFKIPYSNSGARGLRQTLSIKPYISVGQRELKWGRPNSHFPMISPTRLVNTPPPLPPISSLPPKPISILRWFFSVRKSLRRPSDIRNALRLITELRHQQGYAIATTGPLTIVDFLTICFWRRFAVILCFIKSSEMETFVGFLHRLDSFLKRLDRLNTFNGVIVPFCADLPNSFSKSHAHSELVMRQDIVVFARLANGELKVARIPHSKVIAAAREGVLEREVISCQPESSSP